MDGRGIRAVHNTYPQQTLVHFVKRALSQTGLTVESDLGTQLSIRVLNNQLSILFWKENGASVRWLANIPNRVLSYALGDLP